MSKNNVRRKAMMLKPRHLAAVQYSLLATFLGANWYNLLSPPERAIGQLQFIFAEGYERRVFFIVLAFTTIAAFLLAVAYWLPRSTLSPFSTVLPLVAVGLFGVALWQFDNTLTFGFGLACSFALWARYAPNMEQNSRRADKRRAN
jgi:hypothetical protein